VKSPLRILYLEDDEKDAELLQATLEAEGVDCLVTRVETREDFLSSLEKGGSDLGFDLILADYSLPSFDGISALKLAVDKRPELPFIFVSGTMGEEVAIEALKIGATDYVLKTRLSRILPSVQRALREGEQRAERAFAEEALRRSEAYLSGAQRLSQTGSVGWKVSSGELYWSEETYRIFAYDRTTKPTVELFLQRVHPEDVAPVKEIIERAAQEKEDYEHKYRLLMPDGSIKYVHFVAQALTDVSGEIEFIGAVRDETAAKRAEEALFHVGLEARVSERMRIAREMHDTLLQSLQGLMLRFQAVRNMLPRRPEDAMRALDGALTRADQALTESRDAIQGLRSAPIAAIDLADLLTAMGKELDDSQEASCDSPAFCVKVEGERQTLAPNLQDEIYRIGREALRNAFQHADARHIYAEILFDEHQLRLRIHDDGKGIAPKVLEEGGRAGHWGLIGVRERAKRMGAQLDIRSEAGAGTEVQLTVPASVAYEPSPADHGWKPVLQED
jgi:PAS domain S-box-containing protein